MRRQVVPYGPDLWGALAPTWAALAAAETSAFLSPEWVGAWVGAFGDRRRPRGVVWHAADGAPIGCALLSVGRARLGPWPVRRAYLNASGFGAGCEHNDILCRAEDRSGVLDDFVALVAAAGIDELALEGVREELHQDLWARWPEAAWEGHLSEAPYVDLLGPGKGGGSYVDRLSANTRSQIRRSVRLYEERFGAPDVAAAASVSEVRAWFGDMVSLHEQRWREVGQAGAFAHPAVRAFHLGLLERAVAGESGELRPELLRVSFGSHAVAFLHHLRYRGRVNFFQSGLSYHDDNRLKPGLVAHALAIEHYRAAGELEYDFLGGEPAAVRYKRSMSTGSRTLAWTQLPSPTPQMRLLRGARLARRGVRALLRRA